LTTIRNVIATTRTAVTMPSRCPRLARA
jgi:hypothetical protein